MTTKLHLMVKYAALNGVNDHHNIMVIWSTQR